MRLPIVKQDGTEYRDASELSTLLASAGDDLYLLAGQAWHGGIHISEDGAPWAKDIHPVRCVADGEVVAYRMMPDYLTSDFKGETYRYSNSFCLVRHNIENPGTDGEQQGFSYYSLYMHLCPWNAWPSAKRYRLKKRWNVRNSVPHHGDPLPAVTLPAGEIFEPVEGEALQQGKIDGVSYDFMRIRVLSDGVSNSQVDATKGNDTLWIAQDTSALDEVSIARPAWVYGEVDAVLKTDMHGRADPKTQKGTTGFAIAGDPAHLVPEGTQIQFDAHHVRLQEIGGKARKMARCIIKPSGRAQWICVEEQYLEVVEQKPTQLGKLYELPSPVSIKAGDVIGYLGLYEGPASLEGGTTGNAMIHLEVFSTDKGVKSIVESEKWQEDGFRLVDGSDCDGVLDPENVPAFFRSLCAPSNDDTLDADAVISKLTSQTAADERHKIVARHNSEWWTPTSEAMMVRFKEIYTSPESHALIDHELERVRHLGWMDKTSRLGFDGPDVWHFYPLLPNLLATDISIEDARIRAFMRAIRVGEGTVGHDGYETLFGGESFIKDYGKDFSDHPRIKIKGGGLVSSAAGAYQVMGYTWDDPSMVKARTAEGINDFTPLSQDIFCLIILSKKRPGSLESIRSGDIDGALKTLSYEWASLPPGRYGQPAKSKEQFIAIYDDYLKQELDGISDLFIPIGKSDDF